MNVHLAKRPMNVHTTDTPHTTSTRHPPSICLRFLRKVARFPIPTGCALFSNSAVSPPGACSHPPGTARAPSGTACLIRLLVALLGGLVVADLDHLELVRGRHRRLGVGRLVRGRLDLARGLGRRLLLLLLLLVGGDLIVGVGELLLDVFVLLVDRLSRVLEQVALPALRVRGDLRELLHRRLARLLVARLLILDAVRVLLHGRLPRDLEAAAPLLLLLLPVRALLVGGALRRDPPRLRVRLHVRPGVVGRPDERRGGRLVLHARRLGRLESRVLRVHLELGARSVRCRVRGLRAVLLLLLLLLLLLRLARLLNQLGRVLALGLQLRLGRLGRLGRFRRLGGRLLGLLGGLRLLLLLLLRLLGVDHRRGADRGH